MIKIEYWYSNEVLNNCTYHIFSFFTGHFHSSYVSGISNSKRSCTSRVNLDYLTFASSMKSSNNREWIVFDVHVRYAWKLWICQMCTVNTAVPCQIQYLYHHVFKWRLHIPAFSICHIESLVLVQTVMLTTMDSHYLTHCDFSLITMKPEKYHTIAVIIMLVSYLCRFEEYIESWATRLPRK